MCLISVKLFIVHTIFCVPLFPTYTTITITITVCSIFFSHNHLVVYSQRRSLNTQLHTKLTEFLLTVVSFVLHFHIPTRSVKWTFLKKKVRILSFSRTLSRPLVYVHHAYVSYLSVPHACCCWFIWRVFHVYLSVYFCIVYTLPLVAFVFSIPFSHADVVGGLLGTSSPHLSVQLLVYLCIKLIIVVGIAFVYCIHGKLY